MVQKEKEYFALLRRDDYRRVFKAILESIPPIRITALSKTLNETEDFVKRRVLRLNKYGFGFGADYDQQKTGLGTIVVHLNKQYIPSSSTRVMGLPESLKWVLRWQGNGVLPKQMGILIFYVPMGRDYTRDFHRILLRTYGITKMFFTDVTVYGKPDLSLINIGIDGNVKTLWNRVTKIIEEASYNTSSSIIPRNRQVSLDLLDIITLAALQRNAFYTLKEIASLLKTTVSKIHRHLNHHLIETNVITGTKLLSSPRRSDSSKVMLYIHGQSEPERIFLLTSILKRVFEFRSALINSRTGEYAMLLIVDVDDVGKIADSLEKISNLFGDYSISVVARETVRSYTIPFLAFHREKRDWSLEVNVIDLMREKLSGILTTSM